MGRVIRALAALLLIVPLYACAAQVSLSGKGSVAPVAEGALRLASWNVHYIVLARQSGAWSLDDWERRKGPMDAAIKEIGADLIALQEAESFGGGSVSEVNLTVDYLLAQNPDLAAAATGDPQVFPATQPILYRAARLEVLDQGWFFFSDTPDVIYSRTFNGSWPAFASWAQFRDKTSGAVFRVLNLHFEYRSRSNRRQSAALVRDRIAPWIAAGETVLLAGDLNALRGSRTQLTIAEAGLTFAPVEGATYHFNRGLHLFGAIDHLGYSAGASLQGAPVVLRRQWQGEWPADHHPIFADFSLKGPGDGS